MKFFRIFRRKAQEAPRSLRIDGVATPMTPAPDDDELAAQALLESLATPAREKGKVKSEQFLAKASVLKKRLAAAKSKRGKNNGQCSMVNGQSEHRDVEYYRQLSEKIRASRAAEARLTMRYLAYCEEQLALPKELYVGQIDEMEQGLYKRQDVAEREGGELLRRWQHCLAEVIVRQMSAVTDADAADVAAT